MNTKLTWSTIAVLAGFGLQLAACEMNYRGASGSGGSGGSGGAGGSTGGGTGGSAGGGTGGSAGGGTGGAGGGSTACNTVHATGPWSVYPDPYLDGGPNPASGISGSVDSCTQGTGSRVVLTVSGLTASRAFGSHVHVAACDAGMGGGHYRNDPDAGPSPQNEVWLDFSSDGTGAATSAVTAAWIIRPGAAKSVIVHSRTSDDAGVAGPKLGCIDVPF